MNQRRDTVADDCPQPQHPVIETIANFIYESGGYLVSDRERPYSGQPHTDQGERGKTLVGGLTMRDVCDCFVLGWLMADGRSGLAESGQATAGDIYGDAPIKDIDPLAAMQNMMCEVERRMGIYPNVPGLECDE